MSDWTKDAAWLEVQGVGQVHERCEITPNDDGSVRIYDPKSKLSLTVAVGHPLWFAAEARWTRAAQ